MKRLMRATLGLVLVAGTARADVKVVSSTGGKGMGQMATGTSTTYVKGNKMRSETQMGEHLLVSVIDLDAQKMFSLDSKKKQAEVHDLARLRAELDKTLGSVETRVSLTPNGQKKSLIGHDCAGYDLAISVPMSLGDAKEMGPMTIHMRGPVWIAKGVDGFDDYATFFKAAVEKGMFFSNPQQARAQPGQARGMAEMYRVLASTGMPLEQEIAISMEGSGPLAAMMAKMGNSTITSTVTAMSSGSLSDDLFVVPAGYKVKGKD